MVSFLFRVLLAMVLSPGGFTTTTTTTTTRLGCLLFRPNERPSSTKVVVGPTNDHHQRKSSWGNWNKRPAAHYDDDYAGCRQPLMMRIMLVQAIFEEMFCRTHMSKAHAKNTCEKHMLKPHAKHTCQKHMPQTHAKHTREKHMPNTHAKHTCEQHMRKSHAKHT